jgi:Domain of unknown function (DUF1772)
MNIDLLEFATLIVTGFTSCAEFGSYAFVHPVIRDLPSEHHIAFAVALISTIVFNVPINLATGRWQSQDRPANWKQVRNRWEFFQGVRSWLLLIGFILLCFAVATHP